jgi:hypothetical protein
MSLVKNKPSLVKKYLKFEFEYFQTIYSLIELMNLLSLITCFTRYILKYKEKHWN